MTRLLGEFSAPDTKLLPKESQDYNEKYNAAFQAWLKDFQTSLGRNTMSPEHAAVAVPKTTIDLGSAAIAFATGADAAAGFEALYLPTRYQTTTNLLETALDYTGRGVLQRVVGISQSAAGTSTSAGFQIFITLDDTVIYGANPTTTVNRMVAVVGSLGIPNTAFFLSFDDAAGLPFNKSCKVEIKNLTAGQPVQVGWRVLKKL